MSYPTAQAKAWARDNLRGHIVTTITPFHDDLTVDVSGLRANVAHLLELPCVQGMYVNSVFQEVTALTVKERLLVLRTVVEAVEGRVPVVAVASGNAVADVVEAAGAAQDIGADVVMVWPPTFGYRTSDGVLEFMRQVARQVEIGLCVYASGLSEFGFRLTPSMLVELARIEHVCGVKEASLSLGTYLDTLAAVGDQLVVSCPLDEYWVAGRRLAPSRAPDVLLGTSRPLYLETPRTTLLSDLRHAVHTGEPALIEAALATVVRLANELHTRFLEGGGHNIALAKAVAGVRGLATGPVRPPMSAPPASEIRQATEIMRQAGLVDV
jgi:4-hydroxy-tetrahydrodipicolinate synthase